jgi:GH18 family chitinase
MDVRAIDSSVWSHIHYSFATVTSSFELDISRISGQFDYFKSLKDMKRILAIGGWDFSSSPETYNIFRLAVNAANREKFATNCVNFVAQHGLDGLDFDWEYPSAPDNQGTGIPPGNVEDGENYFQFLTLLRAKLPKGKSISIAAPAWFWYLKGFPIEKIATVVNYIVYMTYDLHGQFSYYLSANHSLFLTFKSGQWDYANKWSSSGKLWRESSLVSQLLICL